MKKKALIGVVFFLVSALLLGGCAAISQEIYDAVVAEQDARETQIESLQSELASVKEERDQVKSDFAAAQSVMATLQSDLSQAQANLQAVGDWSEEAQLEEAMAFLQEVNWVLTTDFPTVEDTIAAWQDLRELAVDLNPSLLPHIDNIIYQFQVLGEILAAAPAETASLEETVTWTAEVVQELVMYIEYYTDFEVALRSSMLENIESLSQILAGE